MCILLLIVWILCKYYNFCPWYQTPPRQFHDITNKFHISRILDIIWTYLRKILLRVLLTNILTVHTNGEYVGNTNQNCERVRRHHFCTSSAMSKYKGVLARIARFDWSNRVTSPQNFKLCFVIIESLWLTTYDHPPQPLMREMQPNAKIISWNIIYAKTKIKMMILWLL